MIKNIMLKMLMRVITTGLAVSGGIAGPAAASFCQNTADISVIVEEGVRTAETIADTMPDLEETYTVEKAALAQENMTKQESGIPDRQSADTTHSADAQRTAAGQNSADVQQAGSVQKTADAANTTQPETKTETAGAVTQPETVVPAEETAATSASSTTSVIPEYDTSSAGTVSSDRFVTVTGYGTNTVSGKDFVINKPDVEEPKVEEPVVEEPKVEEPKVEEPKTEEVEEPVVEEPKVQKVWHNCNCGWTTEDYEALKWHMLQHALNGEAYSYSTHVGTVQ